MLTMGFVFTLPLYTVAAHALYIINQIEAREMELFLSAVHGCLLLYAKAMMTYYSINIRGR